MRDGVLIFLMVSLCGCASQGNQPADGSSPVSSSQPSSETRTFRGDYFELATCSEQNLEAIQPGLRRAYFPETKTIVLSLLSGNVKYWEVNFRSISDTVTVVNVTAAAALTGPPRGAEKVMAEVEKCASR
jgi:hypothetical protein